MEALPIPPIPHEASSEVLYWVISVLGVAVLALAGTLTRIWLQLQSSKDSVARLNQAWSDKLQEREQRSWKVQSAADKWQAWARGEMLRLTVLLEHQGDVLAIISADAETMLITGWNAGASMLFGWASHEVKGHSVKMLIPERYLARHEEALHKCVTERNRIPRHGPFEVHALTKGREEVPITVLYAAYVEQRHMFMAIIQRRSEEPDDGRGGGD